MKNGLCVVALAVVVVGCEEKKPPLPVAPPASALAASSASAPAASTVKLALDEGTSVASLDMPAPKEHIVAKVQGIGGSLTVVPRDLAKSRGEVKFDLLTLTTSTFKDDRDKDQTAHARTWLEVADGEKGKLPEDVKAQNRYAVFAIRSIENASATDLSKVAPTKAPDGSDVREVTMLAKGELLVHGHKVDRDVEVKASFGYPTGAPAEMPSTVGVVTTKPARVVLAEHDVKPRDATGKLAKDFFHLLGTKVADTADVTLDLRAKREP